METYTNDSEYNSEYNSDDDAIGLNDPGYLEIKLNKNPKKYFENKNIFDDVQILKKKITKLRNNKNNTEKFNDTLFRQLFYKLPSQIFKYYTKGYVIFKLGKNDKLYFAKSYQNEFKRYYINKSKRKFKNIHFQMNCKDIFESLFIDKIKEKINTCLNK